MFRRIVVGVDEHEGSRDAIELAERLRHRRGELILAQVYGCNAHLYRGGSRGYLATEAEQATKTLEAVRGETGVTAHLRRWVGTSVGKGLDELCELMDAELLVVGSSQRGTLGRVMLGDDSRAALDVAPCALAIAPLGYRTQAAVIREVGVAYNGSSESELALAVARTVAAEHRAKLSAFEAVTFPTYTYVPNPEAEASEATCEQLLDDARRRISALGGLEPHAAFGHPADELAVYSASLDLLVIGSRGYGPLGRLVHGSVSRQLIRQARCPLLILPRSARVAEHATPPSKTIVTSAA